MSTIKSYAQKLFNFTEKFLSTLTEEDFRNLNRDIKNLEDLNGIDTPDFRNLSFQYQAELIKEGFDGYNYQSTDLIEAIKEEGYRRYLRSFGEVY